MRMRIVGNWLKLQKNIYWAREFFVGKKFLSPLEILKILFVISQRMPGEPFYHKQNSNAELLMNMWIHCDLDFV
jgi:hypothetical protein